MLANVTSINCYCIASSPLFSKQIIFGVVKIFSIIYLQSEKPKPVILTSKEAHAKGKALRHERRQKDRSHYDTTVEIKKIWEELRRLDLPKDQRQQLCARV